MDARTVDARIEFDAWSSHYDRGWLQRWLFHPSHRVLLEQLGPADERILDVGCGTGQLAAAILERLPEARVWGLDLSPRMLDHARRRAAESGGRFFLVQGDSEQLPFADDSFDVVTCSHSFHHYPHQDRVAAEMFRVLRPGGRLLLLDGDRDGLWGWFLFNVCVVAMEGPVRHLTAKAVRHLYQRAGFGDVSQQRRGGPLPFLLTAGRAIKSRRPLVAA
jgi:ubiquinone/menaquinone biosynthesis C-methylase UbiE